MPAIKLKKAAAEHQAEKEREERERESDVPSTSPVKPKEASSPGAGLLKGLDSNIIFEKRKRPVPPSEQKLIDWIELNLESKEECHVSLNSLYEFFGEACSFDGTPVVDQPMFNKRIHDKFGKSFALKESSPYKGLIKEKKSKAAKASSGVKADSLKIKMKDIIEEAIKEAGNPTKGVRFFSLKQYIACNYPALRVDLRPAYLKVALERGVKYGYIQLVRGVGLAGYYRLPTDEEPDETEEKPAEKEEENVPAGDAGTEQQNGHAEAPGEKSEEDPGTKKPKKSRKRKTPEGEEGEAKEGEGDGTEEPKKKKKKKRHAKKKRPKHENFHSSPQKIEDTFALAMTYMCEPKQTSFGKIKKYITEHYPHVNAESELKSAMESGERKGFWEHVTGQGLSGTFRLMIDEFDPNSTDNIEDMICSALIACNEPKQASSNLLKKYVMEYHPEFKLDARPHLFKMALERALRKQMIIQLSGIGASGSFQMWSAFSPSPALLAGEDDSDVEDDFKEEKLEVYIPRGTKSRALSVRKSPAERSAESRPKPAKRPSPSKRSSTSVKKNSASRGRPKSAKSSSRSRSKVSYKEKDDQSEEESEEVEDEDDEPPPKKARTPNRTDKRKKAKKPAKASPKKKAAKPVSRAELTAADDRPSKKSKGKAVDEEEALPKKVGRGRPKSRPNYAEDNEGSDDDQPKSNRNRRSSGSRKSKKVNYSEEDEDADVEEESDGDDENKTKTKKSGARQGSKKISYNEKDEEEDEEEAKVEYTPRKSKSRGGEEVESSQSPKKGRRKR